MNISRGAGLAIVVAAALAALAIIYPRIADKEEAIVTELPPSGTTFSELEKDEIRNTVREYLIENPTVIVEALEALQERQQLAEQQGSQSALAANMESLLDDRRAPSIGNPDASVTVVEFFDYQCPYCKQMANDMVQLVADDPDLRIVFKEFPVFGDGSTLAARAALAANKQGKYTEFHLAMMALPGAASESVITRLADRYGLDNERLRRDMASEDIEAEIQSNYRLAREIGVRGTPAFVIGDQLIPGAMSLDALRELIAREREKT